MKTGEPTVETGLAVLAGMSTREFVDRFGTGWERGPEPDWPLSATDEEWHLSGAPPQLMMAIDDDGHVRLARPHGRWNGVARLEYQPVDVEEVTGDRATDSRTIAKLLRRRRATFAYCRLCRDLTPPERRQGDLCMACDSTWNGTVY